MKYFEKIFTANRDNGTPRDDMLKFLKQYNCTWRESQRENDPQRRIFFDFQAGHFIALFEEDDSGVEILFPAFATAPPEGVNVMRSMCNNANAVDTPYKYWYNHNESDNELEASLSFFCNVVEPDKMANWLKKCFQAQRIFYSKLKNAYEMQIADGGDDIEYEAIKIGREQFLTAQAELTHEGQRSSISHRFADRNPLTLGNFIENALGIEHCLPQSLQLTYCSEQKVVDVPRDRISDFDLLGMLVADHGSHIGFSRDIAVALLRFTVESGSESSTERALTITAMGEGDDGKSLYIRLTACVNPLPVGPMNSVKANGGPKSVSMLVARDRATDTQREQEFDYMWKDAQLKLRDGEKLTQEQKLICDVVNGDTARHLYWGKSLMLDKRYYEALQHFESAYNNLLPTIFEADESHGKKFMEVCYCLGFCYNQLHLYRQAFYYLQLFESSTNIRHATQWINCLVNRRDVRAFKAIDSHLRALAEAYKDTDDVPNNVASFAKFLQRRRAYALVDFNDFDEAEKMLKEMLEDPDCADFATNELAHIARIRLGLADNQVSAPADSDTEQ